MTRFPLRRAACDRGGVAERLKAADCKSADVRLRRFESYPLHQRLGVAAVTEAWREGSGAALRAGEKAGKGEGRLRLQLKRV
jgi:hypothetical protein